MNVTLKIDDALGKQFKHAAVDDDLSLSKWMEKAALAMLNGESVDELRGNVSEPSIADAFYCPRLEAIEEERGLNFEDSLESRKPWKSRELEW